MMVMINENNWKHQQSEAEKDFHGGCASNLQMIASHPRIWTGQGGTFVMEIWNLSEKEIYHSESINQFDVYKYKCLFQTFQWREWFDQYFKIIQQNEYPMKRATEQLRIFPSKSSDDYSWIDLFLSWKLFCFFSYFIYICNPILLGSGEIWGSHVILVRDVKRR